MLEVVLCRQRIKYFVNILAAWGPNNLNILKENLTNDFIVMEVAVFSILHFKFYLWSEI